MIIFPAIDLRNGKCVRLTQGREEAETIYGDDPVQVARRWVEEGATWLHLVDLDGAFAGEPRQLPVVAGILQAVKIPVQLGGGLRSLEQIQAALEAGVARVILGTVAITDPDLVRRACRRFGSQCIIVGIDARNGFVAVRGWHDESTRRSLDVALEMREAGCRRVVFTDTSRDGMLTGPNLSATGALAKGSGLQVIASGGVSSLEDLVSLRALEAVGVEGAILGKSLYEGKIHLSEALMVAVGQLKRTGGEPHAG
jgi:phosphoribosylformimino-5-aminoimidazole carboxamide ribotide isomerase